MKARSRLLMRRSVFLAAIGVLVAVLTACTGRGGGQLPPDNAQFKGPASFGFSFSCEDKGGINPPTGQLRIQLSYNEHGNYLPIGRPFGIHGIVDTIDPVLESQICIGRNPPPGGNELIFLGRYRLTSSAPAGLPATCRTQTPTCRFKVIVRDNDRNLAPSPGDFFSIKLSTVTELLTPCPDPMAPECGEFPVGTVVYARAGTLSSGNLTVN